MMWFVDQWLTIEVKVNAWKLDASKTVRIYDKLGYRESCKVHMRFTTHDSQSVVFAVTR